MEINFLKNTFSKRNEFLKKLLVQRALGRGKEYLEERNSTNGLLLRLAGGVSTTILMA